MTDDKAEIALKYLELARGEISEKGQFVNQTLGGYLLGACALASWFYQSIYKASTGAADVDKVVAAVGLAVILSYLSLGVNWIIHHNERMVTALARYQREELGAALGNDPKMWEQSSRLNKDDRFAHACFTVIVQESIVLGPAFAASIYGCNVYQAGIWGPAFWGLACALIGNALSIAIGVFMVQTKYDLRGKKPRTH